MGTPAPSRGSRPGAPGRGPPPPQRCHQPGADSRAARPSRGPKEAGSAPSGLSTPEPQVTTKVSSRRLASAGHWPPTSPRPPASAPGGPVGLRQARAGVAHRNGAALWPPRPSSSSRVFRSSDHPPRPILRARSGRSSRRKGAWRGGRPLGPRPGGAGLGWPDTAWAASRAAQSSHARPAPGSGQRRGEPRAPALEAPSTPAPRPPGPPAASKGRAGRGCGGARSPLGSRGHGQGGRSFDWKCEPGLARVAGR